MTIALRIFDTGIDDVIDSEKASPCKSKETPQEADATRFLSELVALSGSNLVDMALDRVFDYVDDRITANELERCDHLLNSVPLEIHHDILFGFLAKTAPVRDRLPHRTNLVSKMRTALKGRVPDKDLQRLFSRYD